MRDFCFHNSGFSSKKTIWAAGVSLPSVPGVILLLPFAKATVRAHSMRADGFAGAVFGPGGTATDRRSYAI